MKPMFSCLFVLLFAASGFAQTDQTITVNANHQFVCFNSCVGMHPQPVFIAPAPVAITTFAPGQTGTYTFDNAFILRSPARYSINSLAAMLPGVYSVNGERPCIYGSRPEATVYYIDGIRMLEYEPLFMDATYTTIK